MTDYIEKQKFPDYLLNQLDKCLFCEYFLTKQYNVLFCKNEKTHIDEGEMWCYYDDKNDDSKITSINIVISQYQFCFSLMQNATAIYNRLLPNNQRIYKISYFLDIKFDKKVLLEKLDTILLLA